MCIGYVSPEALSAVHWRWCVMAIVPHDAAAAAWIF